MMKTLRWWLFLLLGFYLSAVLSVLPMPVEFQWYRPQWVLMLFIYCQISNPKSFNPIVAWIGGLFIDVLVGMPIGTHGLVFSIVSYLALMLRSRFLMRPIWQQIGKVALLLSVSQILILWFHALSGKNPHTLLYWMSTVSSCLFWPLFVKLLQSIAFLFKVSTYSPRSI